MRDEAKEKAGMELDTQRDTGIDGMETWDGAPCMDALADVFPVRYIKVLSPLQKKYPSTGIPCTCK